VQAEAGGSIPGLYAAGATTGDAEGASQIGINHIFEIFIAHAQNQSIFGDSCVSNDDFWSSPFFFNFVEGGLHAI
jgi:hypothetical protein